MTSRIRLGLLIPGLALLAACSSAPPAEREFPVPDAPPPEEVGKRLYSNLCVNCHGEKGLGDGRLAALLTMPTPDLTTLSQRNGGTFPRQAVRDQIDGTLENEAHGPRVMPQWGSALSTHPGSEAEEDRAGAAVQIEYLVDYLDSIQK